MIEIRSLKPLENGQASLRFGVSGFPTTDLTFKFENVDRAFLADGVEPALIALLIPAMVAGKNIRCIGPLSRELHFRIQKYLVPLLTLAIERANPIQIFADDLVDRESRPQGAVLTGLSNGIDSLHVCAEHLTQDTPEALKVTHFIFHDVGSHGKKKNLSEIRKQKAIKSAADFGIPLITASSNLENFYQLSFQETHTLRSVAIASALSGGVSDFLFASTTPYPAMAMRASKDIADFDAITLPLLSHRSFRCFSVGTAVTRVEKTKILSTSLQARKHLNICVTSEENCSKCWKCMRTMLTLDLLGRLGNFSDVFHIPTYKKRKSLYVSHVLAAASKVPLLSEIRELMQESRFHPTGRQKAVGTLLTPLQRMALKNKFISSAYWKLTGVPADH